MILASDSDGMKMVILSLTSMPLANASWSLSRHNHFCLDTNVQYFHN